LSSIGAKKAITDYYDFKKKMEEDNKKEFWDGLKNKVTKLIDLDTIAKIIINPETELPKLGVKVANEFIKK
jgi:hypothetical protein